MKLSQESIYQVAVMAATTQAKLSGLLHGPTEKNTPWIMSYIKYGSLNTRTHGHIGTGLLPTNHNGFWCMDPRLDLQLQAALGPTLPRER